MVMKQLDCGGKRYVNEYDQDALATLFEYNKENVVNLKTLKEKLL